MICKWCGAGVSPAEKKCSRCGREIPALSDCGGFYDVAPRAPRNPGQPQSAAPAAPAGAVAPVVQKKSAGKMGMIVTLIAAVIVALLAVGMIFLVNQISELELQIHHLESELEDAYDELDQYAGTMKPTNPTEPSVDPSDSSGDEPTGEPTEPSNDSTEDNAENQSQNGWFIRDDLSDWEQFEEGKTVDVLLKGTKDGTGTRKVALQDGILKGSYVVRGENLANYPGKKDHSSTLEVEIIPVGKNAYEIVYQVSGKVLGTYSSRDQLQVEALCDDATGLVEMDDVKSDDQIGFSIKIPEGEEGKIQGFSVTWHDGEDILALELTGLDVIFPGDEGNLDA